MRRSLFRRSDLWYTLFVVGMVAALAGFGAAFLVFQLLGPQGGWMGHAQQVIPLAAALSSLLIGPSLWWRLISQPRTLTVRRGISCGVLSSLVAHPLTWFLVTALYALTNTDHVATSLGVVLFVAGLLDVPFWSLIYLGWFTALIGAVTGATSLLRPSGAPCGSFPAARRERKNQKPTRRPGGRRVLWRRARGSVFLVEMRKHERWRETLAESEPPLVVLCPDAQEKGWRDSLPDILIIYGLPFNNDSRGIITRGEFMKQLTKPHQTSKYLYPADSKTDSKTNRKPRTMADISRQTDIKRKLPSRSTSQLTKAESKAEPIC